jgi:hypothetical protein
MKDADVIRKMLIDEAKKTFRCVKYLDGLGARRDHAVIDSYDVYHREIIGDSDNQRTIIVEDYYKIVDDVVLLVTLATVVRDDDEVVERTCRERVFDESESTGILDLLRREYMIMSGQTTCTVKNATAIVCYDSKTNELLEAKIHALAMILPP